MARPRPSSAAFVLPVTFALSSVVVACSGGGGGGPNATIMQPPFPTTPSPAPTVQVAPASLNFPSGSAASQRVTLNAPLPTAASFSIVQDTCSKPGIASAQPSPSPSSNPSQPSPVNVYVVFPGTKNGTVRIHLPRRLQPSQRHSRHNQHQQRHPAPASLTDSGSRAPHIMEETDRALCVRCVSTASPRSGCRSPDRRLLRSAIAYWGRGRRAGRRRDS
jgi:hypothetical protein